MQEFSDYNEVILIFLNKKVNVVVLCAGKTLIKWGMDENDKKERVKQEQDATQKSVAFANNLIGV